MGSGIATALILSNIYVVLKEVNSDYLRKGIKTIEGSFSIRMLSEIVKEFNFQSYHV